MKFSKLFAGAAVAAAVFTSSSAFAAVYAGSNANFSFTADDVNNLFGAPIVEGAGLSFLPTSFRAISANGSGAITSGTLPATFTAAAGAPGIIGVNLNELGDYSINDGGDVYESAYLVVRVLDANYAGNKLFTIGSNPPFSKDTKATAGDAAGEWTDALSVVLPAPARSIMISLNNNLHANSIQGGTAIIQKKSISGDDTPGINIVTPEPATMAAVLGGLSLLGFRRRTA